MTLLVFGMDGAVREYVEEAIDRGLMPNMEELIEDGCFGDLDSSKPPITIPAWPSMFSGMHPDRFSTFHMTEMDEGYEVSPVPNERWKDLQLWRKLDGRFGLLAIPGLVPPYQIDGYMVTGFPLVTDPKTYPEDFIDVSDLDFRETGEKTTREGRRRDFLHNFRQRANLFDQVDEDVDVRVEVYQITDAAVHRSAKLDHVMEAYSAVDEVLGRRMGEYDDVLLASDHGFQHVERMFYTNVFLEKEGYLERKSESSGKDGIIQRVQSLAAPLAETPLRPFLKYVNDFLRTNTSVDFSPKSFETERVDFESTQAFSYRGGANNFGEITINDDRFEGAVVENRREKAEEIAEKLREEKLVDEVWRREELYDEPEGMPDIVFRAVEGVGVGVSLFSKKEFETDAFVHSETGVVVAMGPSFREGEVSGQLADIAPTIAEYLGQELDCDGEALDIFSEAFKPRKPGESDTSGIDI